MDAFAFVARAAALPLVALALLHAQGSPASGDPTFLIFKYQHIVGREIDRCTRGASAAECHAHFQLDFTGSSIALDADIRTGPRDRPLSYSAHGQNSTRSFVDLDVTIDGGRASVRENGSARSVRLPRVFFTLEEDVPFVVQELLLTYWQANGHPARIALVPDGEARIRPRGTMRLPGNDGETLTRYSVHGVTWGDETVWLNPRGEIAAVVGADAEEDRIEVVRPRYESALKDFARQAAADAVADMEAAAARVRPIAAGTFALTHATIVNPESDDAPARDATILIRDGRIAAAGAEVTIPKGAAVFDAAGAFVLPGLWDTHAHFEQWEWGPAYLASGVTSVRDMGNEIEFLGPIRQSLDAGRGLGPRMYAAGLIDSDPGSLTSEHAEDAEAARAIVRRYRDLRYEEIKIYQSLRPALIPVVASEAHRLGMEVIGHIPTGTDALAAVRDGMDQITHIGFVTRVMRPQGVTEVRADSREAMDTIRLLLDRHTVVEPTLARSEFNGHPKRRPFVDFEPSTAWLPHELAIVLNNAGVNENREALAAASLLNALKTTKILYDAGVPILPGSDLVSPGSSLHRELELLVRAGLTPLQALRAATTVPAKVLGVVDAGAVRVGRRADLVVLDADPLADISNVRQVRWTISRGSLFEPGPLWNSVDIKPARVHQH